MSILLMISLLIIAYIIGEKILDNYIFKTINSYLNLYLYGEKIELKGNEKEIVEGLVLSFIHSITGKKENKIGNISIIRKAKAAYNVYSYLEEFIDYLTSEYGAILQANKKEVPSVSDNSRDNKVNQYFVSYMDKGKYITIWFSYLEHRVEIIGGTETFQKMSNREKYEKLLEIFRDIKNDNAIKYNYTKGVEDMFISGFEPVLESDENQLYTGIVVRELKKKFSR